MEPEQLIQNFRQAGKAYAKAKAECQYLDHYRHVVLSSQMALAEANGAKSVAAQDRDARNSPEYQVHLKGLQAAIMAEALRKTDLQAAEYAIEVWRTEQADKRMERKAYAA
jgi:hypothetical protein